MHLQAINNLEWIRIAAYAVDRRRSELPLETLLRLKCAIENSIHVPVPLAFLEEDMQNPQQVQQKTWSSELEGVSRCNVAHHNALFCATEQTAQPL